MKVKEKSEKVGLKVGSTFKKTKMLAPSPITLRQMEGEKVEQKQNFLGLQNHCEWQLQR